MFNFTSCFKKKRGIFYNFFFWKAPLLFASLPDGKIKVWRVFSPTGATGAHHSRQKISQLGRKLCELVSKSLDDQLFFSFAITFIGKIFREIIWLDFKVGFQIKKALAPSWQNSESSNEQSLTWNMKKINMGNPSLFDDVKQCAVLKILYILWLNLPFFIFCVWNIITYKNF